MAAAPTSPRTRRRSPPRIAGVALALGLAGPTAGAAGPDAVVTMSNQLDFQPQRTVVEPGQTVQWKNSSLLVHTVTAVPHLAARAEHVAVPDGGEPFNSGNMEPDDTFRHTFEVPGTYRYFCIPHEGAGMVGEVVVEE